MAASAMPTMGMSNNSLAANRPGSPKAAMIAPSAMPVLFCEHFQRDGAADLGFGARRYVRDAARRGEGDQ